MIYIYMCVYVCALILVAHPVQMSNDTHHHHHHQHHHPISHIFFRRSNDRLRNFSSNALVYDFCGTVNANPSDAPSVNDERRGMMVP